MRTYFLVRQSCYSFLRETICRAGIRLVHQMPTNCTQRLADASNCLLLVAHRLPTSCAACWASGVMEATFMARRTSSRSRPSWRAASRSPPFGRPIWTFGATCAKTSSLPTSLHHSAISLSRSTCGNYLKLFKPTIYAVVVCVHEVCNWL